MKYDVVGIGIVTCDLLATLPKIPTIDETTFMLNFKKELGGTAAIPLVALQRLGMKTAFVGRIGDDEYGNFIMTTLQEEKIDTQFLQIEKMQPSPFSFILIDDMTKKRTIIFNPGCCFNLKLEQPEIETIISNTTALHLDAGAMPVMEKVVKLAKQKNVLVSLDAGQIFPGIENILKDIDLFIPAELCVKQLIKENDMEVACKKLLKEFGCKIVCITSGEKGCIAATKDEIVKQPAFKVNVLDTTGAGDAFHGAFLFGVIKGWQLNRTTEFAAALAAINCTQIGGRSALPKLEEVEEFLQSKKLNE